MAQARSPASRKGLYGKMVCTVVASAPRAVTLGDQSIRTLYVCSPSFLDQRSEIANIEWLHCRPSPFSYPISFSVLGVAIYCHGSLRTAGHPQTLDRCRLLYPSVAKAWKSSLEDTGCQPRTSMLLRTGSRSLLLERSLTVIHTVHRACVTTRLRTSPGYV